MKKPSRNQPNPPREETPPSPQPAEKILSKEDAAKVQRAIVANIIKKIQKGGTATTREMAILKEAENIGREPEWVHNYAELADVFGCHRVDFSIWKKEFEDAPRSRADGWHSVQQWRDWFAKHPEIRSGSDFASGEMQRLGLEEMRQKVRKAIHLNDVREKQFTRNEVFAELIARTVGEAKSLLRMKFEHELPGYTARQEPAQIRVLNKRAVDEVCQRLGELSKAWPI